MLTLSSVINKKGNRVMSIEITFSKENIEQNKQLEIERKFIALDSTVFDQYKPLASHITQLYLSHPDDEYSLRLRKEEARDGTDTVEYTATLKDRGSITQRGLERMEIETIIAEDTYRYYADQHKYAVIQKERAELCDGVTIDWIEGSQNPIIEVENPTLNESAMQFLSHFSDSLIERTGYDDVDNETVAHNLAELPKPNETLLSADTILRDLDAYRSIGQQQLVIGIGGRSGSGKSTLAREIQARINETTGEHAALVSTDDYHRGKTYLESTYGGPWTNWEDARVYDTELLARDIARWQAGETIHKRSFDFTTEEPTLGDPIPNVSIILVEGIHASSRDLAHLRQMYYEVPTPLAVSLGRDLKRLIDTDRQKAAMKSPEERLRYIIECGEPTYQTIEHAPRNVFSESARRIGTIACGEVQR